jgi:uncharacterized membrane protein
MPLAAIPFAAMPLAAIPLAAIPLIVSCSVTGFLIAILIDILLYKFPLSPPLRELCEQYHEAPSYSSHLSLAAILLAALPLTAIPLTAIPLVTSCSVTGFIIAILIDIVFYKFPLSLPLRELC